MQRIVTKSRAREWLANLVASIIIGHVLAARGIVTDVLVPFIAATPVPAKKGLRLKVHDAAEIVAALI